MTPAAEPPGAAHFLAVTLPALNACLNASSLACLLAGYVAIRRGHRVRHMRLMLGALGASALFLVGYLSRVALAGTHRLAVGGAFKAVYLALLGSHMVLAVVILPLIAQLLRLAARGEFARHRRLARWTWPLWVYVSATGVVVYVLLYHVAPRLQALA